MFNSKKIKELEEKLNEMRNGKVRADDTIFPGVRLSINNIVKNVQEVYKHCTMYLDNGEVTLGPF